MSIIDIILRTIIGLAILEHGEVGVGDDGCEGRDATLWPVHIHLILLGRHDVVQKVLGLKGGQMQESLCGSLKTFLQGPRKLCRHNLLRKSMKI